MDIAIQHDFTLARAWAWLKVELLGEVPPETAVSLSPATKSAWFEKHQQGLKGMCQSFDSNQETNNEDIKVGGLQELEDAPTRVVSPLKLEFPVDEVIENMSAHTQPLPDQSVKMYEGEARSDEVMEEHAKTLEKRYEAKHEAEIKSLKDTYQKEIEHLRRTCATEIGKAEKKEQERTAIARELAEKNKLLEMKDELIAGQESLVNDTYSFVNTLHNQFCAGTSCMEQIHELHRTEVDIREQLHNAVKQNQELGRSLAVADKQIKKGKDDIRRLNLEMADQATNLKETSALLRADDIKSVFLDIIRDNAVEVADLKAQVTNRIQETQYLWRLKSQFDRIHESMKSKANADIQWFRHSAMIEINQLKDTLGAAQSRLSALEAEKAALIIDNEALREDIDGFQAENTDLVVENEALRGERDALQEESGLLKADVKATETLLVHFAAKMRGIVAAIDHEQERSQMLTATSKQILPRFQDIVSQLKEEVAQSQKQVSILEANLSKEVDRKRRVVDLAASRLGHHEAAPPLTESENATSLPKPSSERTAVAISRIGDHVQAEARGASTRSNGTNGDGGFTFQPNLTALTGSHTPTVPKQTSFLPTFSEQKVAHTAGPAPQSSVDLSFGGSSGAKTFTFTAGCPPPKETQPSSTSGKEHAGMNIEKKEGNQSASAVDGSGVADAHNNIEVEAHDGAVQIGHDIVVDAGTESLAAVPRRSKDED